MHTGKGYLTIRKALLYMYAVQETYHYIMHIFLVVLMLLIVGINPYVGIKQFLLEVLFNYNEVKDACLLARGSL